MEQIPAHVKKNLNTLASQREEQGMSRKDLQKVSGVREDIIAAYEEGRGRPTRSKYNKLAEYFSWEAWEYGKPTNLTEKQRLAVHSAIFNRLFGDWERTESNENKQEVQHERLSRSRH